MKEEKIKHTISATSFSTYERCPLQYYYKYILELLEPQSDALETGNKVHKFIEDYNNWKEIQDDWSDEYKMFLVYKENPIEGDIISNEYVFNREIWDWFTLTWKIDRRDVDKIIDYKTSSRDYKEEDIRWIQSRLYPYMIYLETGNILPMYYWIINKKKYTKKWYKPQVLRTNFSEEEIKNTEKEIEEFKKVLLKQEYPYKEWGHCFWCPFWPKGTRNCHK